MSNDIVRHRDESCAAASPDAVVVASHRRAGTHLTLDLLRRNLPALAPRYRNLDELARDHRNHVSLSAFRERLASERHRPILKTHTTPGLEPFQADAEVHAYVAALMARSRIVYVVRDGRDTLVSLYHYTRRFDREVARQSFSEFLRSEDRFFVDCSAMAGLDRVSAWRRHIEAWLARPGVHVVRYRDLVADPVGALRRLAADLGMPLAEPIATVALPKRDPWSRVVRRVHRLVAPRRASTAISPGPGRLGDGARWFTPEDEAFYVKRAGPLADDPAGACASLSRRAARS